MAPGMITGRLRFYFPGSHVGGWGSHCSWECRDPRVSQYILWSCLTAQPMAIKSATMIEHMKYVVFVRDIGQGGGQGKSWGKEKIASLERKPVSVALPPSFISQCWECASVTNKIFVKFDFLSAAELTATEHCNTQLLIMHTCPLPGRIYIIAPDKTLFWYSLTQHNFE